MTDKVFEFISESGGAVEIFDIADALGAPVEQIDDALGDLLRAGAVVVTKKGRYISSAGAGLVTATTLVLRSGAPVAKPVDGGRDMLISNRGGMRPLYGDTILVRPEERAGEGMGRCRLIAITRRANQRFEAVLKLATAKQPPERGGKKKGKKGKRGGQAAVLVAELTPVDRRIHASIQLDGGLQGAKDGDMVRLEVTGWPERGMPLRAKITEVLGDAGDIRVRLRALAMSHALREEFPREVAEQAEGVPAAVSKDDMEGREDQRGCLLFTIDGEDAKDFDDAVSLTREGDKYLLGVHIADVSHYVRRGTPIDVEAAERGTSVYLPGLTLPMLPEALSNNICSLMPGVDRLAMSLTMTVTEEGEVLSHALAPSVIHSRARLTYAQVNLMFEGQPSNVPEELHEALNGMRELSLALRRRRMSRGSIDFDLPEAAFTLDGSGRPTDVRARERGESERLIEDFMLAANETVARAARESALPIIYRVHSNPDLDKIAALDAFLSVLGATDRLGVNPSPARYQTILAWAEGREESSLIKQVMLKSLKRAEYSPKPEGHFGLAAKDYCHFTSPIRRYPDLEVHRMLKLMLSGTRDYSRFEGAMPALAAACSAREHAATLAERDADDMLKAYYMAGHIGERYSGIVTGVTAWGVYVTLPNTVEGLVHVRTMPADYTLDAESYALYAHTGGRIRLGDAVDVIVDSVNAPAGEIDFVLADGKNINNKGRAARR